MDERKENGLCGGGACGVCAGGKCSPMHWACCIVPILAIVFWIGGIASLVLAWSAGDGLIWGKADAYWYLNALALGVLATGARGKKLGSCRNKISCCGDACADCKNGTCK